MVEDPNKKPDPNALKFIPGGIRVSKSAINTISSLQSLISYSLTIRHDSFGLILEDNQVDSLSYHLVDLAFGSAQVSYLNLSGFGKPEKSCKVQRYGQIMLELKFAEE